MTTWESACSYHEGYKDGFDAAVKEDRRPEWAKRLHRIFTLLDAPLSRGSS